MLTPYYPNKATRKAYTFPTWSNTWPGYRGCSSRTLRYLTAETPTQPPAAGTVMYYDPEQITVWRRGNHNNGRTHSVPPFRFTDYEVGTTTRREFLVSTHKGVSGSVRYFQYGYVDKINPPLDNNCLPRITNVTNSGPNYSTWDELTRNFDSYDTFVKNELFEDQIQSASVDVQNEMVASASSSYDLLTEIAEMKEIPGLISQISNDLIKVIKTLGGKHNASILRAASRLRPRDLLRHPNRLLKKLGDEWMTYRYGIMPLVYSYRDALKTIDRGQDVKTRSTRVIVPTNTNQSLPDISQIYKLKEITGSVTVRGEVFQHFTCDEIAKFSGLGVNPLVTAWELIPYSFVFDWFIDVGGYLSSAVSSTWAQQKFACISTRRKITTRTSVHKPNQDQTITIWFSTPTNWYGSLPNNVPNVVISNPEGLYPLEEVEEDSYARLTVPVSSFAPTFNPSLTWRRLIDGSVIATNKLRREIRLYK